MQVTDEMVNRFLSWQLPHDFAPDAGVSFKVPGYPASWPTGTNLLCAAQAKMMLQHVLSAVPAPMTREFCATYPGTAAGIINALANQIDAADGYPGPNRT